jgi:hypothetical protein|tara:strand:- start:314 stop:505 length:192 start_codon:yes stop_codon:yes gene_type:complete
MEIEEQYWVAIVNDVGWLVRGNSEQDVRDRIALEDETAFVDIVTKSSIVRVLNKFINLEEIIE